uniref:DUF7802 domain-containing protein n=1 Tax=Dendroctonus ponderosae TaxID=77166 RepID=J3JXI2_DENPD|nr:unknown [Dendroctonus ponderosae]
MVDIHADIKNRLFTITRMGGNELLTPGTELTELKFEGFLDWFVCITDPKVHWKYEPTYIISQTVVVLGGLFTLIHAIVRGGRLPWLWFGITLHGIFVEILCYIIPDVDNFWHSQTPIIFFGRRLPLHIILVYNCLIYNASIAVAKMRLPKWSEPFAVGLTVVLIDLPYDIVGVKFVHWFWHDTDPNIYDRHYSVPWNSYYFHSAFTCSFVFWFHFLRREFCQSKGKWFKGKSFLKEFFATFLASLLGPIGGLPLFIPIYHPLHDVFNIHSEVTYFILLTIFLLLIWSGDRMSRSNEVNWKIPNKTHWTTFLLILHLVLHYTTFWIIPILFNPENEISTGIKEQIGPCNEYVAVQTISGMILQKRKYLCLSDYDETYFDWHCLPKQQHPTNKALWYTSCGTPFENRTEYIAVVSLICLLASVVFYNLHFKSFGDQVFSLTDDQLKLCNPKLKRKKL